MVWWCHGSRLEGTKCNGPFHNWEGWETVRSICPQCFSCRLMFTDFVLLPCKFFFLLAGHVCFFINSVNKTWMLLVTCNMTIFIQFPLSTSPSLKKSNHAVFLLLWCDHYDKLMLDLSSTVLLLLKHESFWFVVLVSPLFCFWSLAFRCN